ncbi:MAG: GDP-mannose 4,6-dehydratase, partial [Candidatus Micrarchaeota archaeon]|nr:GDP-mannose 4,6-dehydratase [Candidatus Micrarchaeota archaeon]
GDGHQKKSYLFVEDAISATLLACEKQKRNFEVYNVGSGTAYSVNHIAKIMCAQMGIKPKFIYTGGLRGWDGDVTRMFLDTRKIRSLGWNERVNIKEGLRRYIRWLSQNYNFKANN